MTKVNQQAKETVAKTVQTFQDVIKDAVKLERHIEKKGGSISNTLLQLARPWQAKDTIGKPSVENSGKFLTACKVAEDYIKSDSARSLKVEKLPRCWTQAKSNIKAAIEFGIDLGQYNTESALRKAVNEARKAAKGIDKVALELKAFDKTIKALPEDVALDLLAQLKELAEEAISELVPVEPVLEDKDVTEGIAMLMQQAG